jgi:hypothetical protein
MSIIITFIGTTSGGVCNEKREKFLFILLATIGSSFQAGIDCKIHLVILINSVF